MCQILTLGQQEAQAAIQAIQAELQRRQQEAVIAVADVHGELIGLLRLDGAPLASIVIATNKTWTAARERKPTRDTSQAARAEQDDFDMAYYGDCRYIGWGGGLPVLINGQVAGAVAERVVGNVLLRAQLLAMTPPTQLDCVARCLRRITFNTRGITTE